MKFRQWIICEDLKNKILEAAGDSTFPDKVMDYLSAVFESDRSKIEKMPWQNTIKLFYHALASSPKVDIPIIKDAPKEGKDVDWNYDGRNLNYYCHILAGSYGWSLEYIYDLEPGQAMALIQEVLTEDFLTQEFYYSLSEVAYPYNSSTKKSHYKPMSRPYWMKPESAEMPKKVKIRRDFLPVGRIVDASGLPENMMIQGLDVERQPAPEKKK